MSGTVLTTGANSGLGLATTIELARAGFHSVGSVRSAAKAVVVHEAASEAGVEVETVLLDVTDAAACEDVVAGLELVGLVNNAGFGTSGAVEEVGDDEARQILETMTIAPMRLARLALPGMRERGQGTIVNISSIYGRVTTPFTGWYQASKHALEGVSDALRMEVAGSGVRVVLVEPGAFKTSVFDDAARDVERRGPDSAYAPGYRRSLDLLRLADPIMGNPQTVAKLVARIMKSRAPRARYLVGPDAFASAVAERVVPTTVWDFVNRRVLGL
ncbi:MAG: putative oxidoreductase [Acidimicrobiales bacterium]|nr:putative oxidoreductase [Acidimicrobiales bacterium]